MLKRGGREALEKETDVKDGRMERKIKARKQKTKKQPRVHKTEWEKSKRGSEGVREE